MKSKLLLASAAIIAAGAFTSPVTMAETTVTQTVVSTKDDVPVNQIDFKSFDVNGDGKYSMEEVGEKLFFIFDTDGNEVIDNMEWNNKNMYTITPMEKETFHYVDTDGDGSAEIATYSYDTFYQESGLIRFDEDKDGLSASEFIQVGYEELDDNEDKMIDLEEWKEAYMATLKPEEAEQERYTDGQ